MTTRSWWCVVDSAGDLVAKYCEDKGEAEDVARYWDERDKKRAPHRAVELVEKGSEGGDDKYHKLMSALKRAKMKHGDCSSGERYDGVPKACTACMAHRYIDEELKQYRGRPIRAASVGTGISEEQREELYRAYCELDREMGQSDYCAGRFRGLTLALNILGLKDSFRARLEGAPEFTERLNATGKAPRQPSENIKPRGKFTRLTEDG